jgi:hypothetical protein
VEEVRVLRRLALSRIVWLVVLSSLVALQLACAPASPPTPLTGAVATATAESEATQAAQAARAGAPVVDPDYIFNQLEYMATHFLHREAGYDTNLSPQLNGHDEFAAYWSQEMQRDLQGFNPQVRRDPFALVGWVNRPAEVPGVNVEVLVPGANHPEQTVVIGCHYDGEAISTQSANDDASGCAIELGVARAMAVYWRVEHVYPAHTLRFVLFDAEEQGIFGSFHYVNQTIAGDLPNLVAMINEEQNGIAYPLRFLGKASNPLLPLILDTAAQQITSPVATFRALTRQAAPAAFSLFRATGIQTLTYRSTNGQPVTQQIFTPDQTNNVQIQDGALAGSDELPFIAAGVPQITIGGNATYYDTDPLSWSYPYDQPQDTIQLMDIFANDSAQRAPALTLSLALPAELTVWLLHQPSVLGEAPASSALLAAICDIGQPMSGHVLALSAQRALDPANPSATFTYHWSFGDGTASDGPIATHTYAAPGTYPLALTVRASSGASRTIQQGITVNEQPIEYANPHANDQADGRPPANPQVRLPSAGS